MAVHTEANAAWPQTPRLDSELERRLEAALEPGEELACCLGEASPGFLDSPLAALNDPEGTRVPAGLPPIVDAHVHLFPGPLFEALWAWFSRNGWPIRYRLATPEVIAFQLERGVESMVALHYAHKPGIARDLNAYMADIVARHPQVVGSATVFPGEANAVAILEDGFRSGLSAVKLHCHVQCVAPDSPLLDEVYQTCAKWDKPLIMHAGREPKSPAYRCDPHELCAVSRIIDALENHPKLRLVVPHLGFDELSEYAALTHRYDNIWLDTTMMLAGFFPAETTTFLREVRPDRLMYGTDFPNLPYAWDRELKWLRDESGLRDESLEAVCGATARALFGG